MTRHRIKHSDEKVGSDRCICYCFACSANAMVFISFTVEDVDSCPCPIQPGHFPCVANSIRILHDVGGLVPPSNQLLQSTKRCHAWTCWPVQPCRYLVHNTQHDLDFLWDDFKLISLDFSPPYCSTHLFKAGICRNTKIPLKYVQKVVTIMSEIRCIKS